MKSKSVFLIVFLSIYGQIACAQNEPAVSDEKNQEPMEEITVIGQRTIATLRIQIDMAADRMIDIFNELNTDDLYDIKCHRVAAVGTHIRNQTCAPAYYDKTEAYMSQLSFMGVGIGASYLNAKLAHYNPIMGQKFKQLVYENQELFDALKKHYELRQELKQQRQAYHGLDE